MKEYITLVVALIIHFLTTSFTYNKGKEIEKINKNQYFDVIQHNFGNYSQFHYLKNIITLSILIPFIIFHSKSKLYGVLGDILVYIPILIIIRSVLTSVTILPSDRSYEIKETNTLLDYFIGDNNDRMFSGHVLFFTFLSYLLIKWNYLTITPLNILLLFLMNIFHAFIIVVTHSHYTIDVFNSFIITILLVTNNRFGDLIRG